MVQYKSIKHSDKESLYKLLNKLPLFSLGDIRDILILINYFLRERLKTYFISRYMIMRKIFRRYPNRTDRYVIISKL